MDDWLFFENWDGGRGPFDAGKHGRDGERALATAREFAERGALICMYMNKDQVLRCFVEGAADMREICVSSLGRFKFLSDHPEAVAEYFVEDDFNALGVDSYTNKTVMENGTALMCARLDPSKFDVSIGELKAEDAGGRGSALALLMKFRDKGDWSLFGRVPSCGGDMPPGNYIMATDERQTKMSCLYGSHVLEMGFSTPICSSVETLRMLNEWCARGRTADG